MLRGRAAARVNSGRAEMKVVGCMVRIGWAVTLKDRFYDGIGSRLSNIKETNRDSQTQGKE